MVWKLLGTGMCEEKEVGYEEFQQLLFMLPGDVEAELQEFSWFVGNKEMVSWLVQILSEWEDRAKTLRPKDHDKVLWRIGSNPLFLGWQLQRKSELGFEEKCEVVQAAKRVSLSIPFLFGPDEPMETAYFMWWDLLVSGMDLGEIGDVILETLSDLSMHADSRVQYSALHGLGHLQHPGRAAAIDLYLQFHPDLATDEWIRQCRDGTVM